MTIATSTAAEIITVMETAITGGATTTATNGGIMVTVMTTDVLKRLSVTRNISKPARNGTSA